MKVKSQSKTASLKAFLGNEISNPEVISGGVKGPIDRDRIKRPACGVARR